MQKPEINMNENVAKYGDRKGCLSRYCSGKKPPDDACCSSYSCHYSRDFKPGEAWKFYYKHQKLQEYCHQKHNLLNRLGRYHDKDDMQCVVRGLRNIEEIPIPAAVPYNFGPDFYVRPWQQQLIAPLQEPPCPVHGFDRPPEENVCNKITRYPPHCTGKVYCCEPCLQDVCSQPRRLGPLRVNPLLKYAPEPMYAMQPCKQLPNSHSYLGVPQPCLQHEPPWSVPQFCCSEKQIKKEWPDIKQLWCLK